MRRRLQALVTRRRASSAEPVGADAAECVILLHLPKTGGTTLWRAVHAELPEEYRLRIARNEDPAEVLGNLPEGKLERLRFVSGHFRFGIHRLLPQPSTYITILRHPVERMLSLYFYATSAPEHWLHRRLKEENVSLEDFLRRDFGVASNNQTRLLAGRGGPLTRQALRTATANLGKHFSVVGTTERFDDTLACLRSEFGWSLSDVRNRNVSHGRPRGDEIPGDLRELILERDAFDVELHAFASELLDRSLRGLSTSGERA